MVFYVVSYITRSVVYSVIDIVEFNSANLKKRWFVRSCSYHFGLTFHFYSSLIVVADFVS